MAGPAITRDVETSLCYCKQLPSKLDVIDMTDGHADERLKLLNDSSTAWYPFKINDIRGREHEWSIKERTFEIVHDNEPERCQNLSEYSDEKLGELLVKPAQNLLKAMFNASHVYTYRWRVRRVSESIDIKTSHAPAHGVHTDYSRAGVYNKLFMDAKDDTQLQQLIMNSRILVVNVWRPLKTVTRDPLAICDWDTVDGKKDLAQGPRFQHDNFWEEMGRPVHNPNHNWYYLSNQKPGELLVFKQFDSDFLEEGGFMVPHSAFVDTDYADHEARESIEIKNFVFIPKDKASGAHGWWDNSLRPNI